MSKFPFVIFCLSLLCSACGFETVGATQGSSTQPDSGTPDVAIQPDAPTVDTNVADTVVTDTNLVDVSTADSGIAPDTGSVTDTGRADVVMTDTGATDTATADTGVIVDTGTDVPPADAPVVTGELDIVQSPDRPVSNIIVAGGDVWHPMNEYIGTAHGESVRSDRMRLRTLGNARSFQAVAIAVDGSVRAYNVLPSGDEQSVDIDLSSAPIIFPEDVQVHFQLWAQVAPVIAYSTDSSPGGHSGDEIALGLMAGYGGGVWSAYYAGPFNVRAYGATSGRLIFAAGYAGSMSMGNQMVVRQSRPYVTAESLTTTTLSSGTRMELYRSQVGADPAGLISLKKITFFAWPTLSPGSTLTLGQFRVTRDGLELPASEASIINEDGDVDLYTGSTNADAYVAVTFAHEDVISGSGHVYGLEATVSGTVLPGDSVTVGLVRSWSGGTPVTGMLASLPPLPGPSLAPIVAGVTEEAQAAGFLWSDLSEIPHSDGCCGAVSSTRDWTNDLFVQDLTVQRVLFR